MRETSEIGPIPAGWQIKTLTEVCSMQSGGTPPKSEPTLWAGDFPWVSGKDLKVKRLADSIDHITRNAAETYSKIAPAGSVLVLVRGMGLANGFALSFIERPMAFNQDLKALTPKGQISGAFLMYALTFAGQRMLQNVANAAHGTKRLSQDDLDNFRLPIPPPDEQQFISSVLDKVAFAVDVEQRAEERSRELKRTAMCELFTRGLRGEPQSWEKLKLGDSFDIKHGFAFDGAFFGKTGEFILLTPGHFAEEGGFRHQREKTKYFTGKIPDEYLLKEGDLLVAMTEQTPGLLGSSALIPAENKFLHNQRLGLVVGLDAGKLDKGYLFYLFNSAAIRAEISRNSSGSKVRHTSPSKIRDITVAIPDLTEQREIVTILEAIDRKIDLHKRKRAVLEELFKSLLHKLMTGEIRVADLNLSALPAKPSPEPSL